MLEEMAVILDHHAATAGSDDDCLHALLDLRPPRVDVAANDRTRFLVRAQVMRQCAAARATLGTRDGDADAVEHAAARAIVLGLGPAVRSPPSEASCAWRQATGRHVGRTGYGRLSSTRPEALSSCGRTKAPRRRSVATGAHGGGSTAARLPGSATDLPLDDRAADVEQAPYGARRGARRFATAAGEAAVEVQLCGWVTASPSEHLLHEIDPAARPVEFVTQQLMWDRSPDRTAMHARAKDRVGFAAFGRVAEFGG